MTYRSRFSNRTLALLLPLLLMAPAQASAASGSFSEDSLVGTPIVVTGSNGTYVVFRTTARVCPPSRLHRCVSVSVDGSFQRAFDTGHDSRGECYTRHIGYKGVRIGRAFRLAFAARQVTGGLAGEPFGQVTVEARKRGKGPLRNACKLVR